MNLNYRTVDTHAIGDPKAQQAIRIIDTTLRPIVQLLREAVVMDPDTGRPFWAAGVIPRALPKDPRGHATYGRLGEFALGTDGTLYQKTVGTEIDNHWRVLGGFSGDDDGSDAGGVPVDVTLNPNHPGFSNRPARFDHHHHLDENIAPHWTSPHRWTVPSSEISETVGALNLTTTLPVPDAAGLGVSGFGIEVTTPTSSYTPTHQSHAMAGFNVVMQPGYTGTGGSYALAFANLTAGIGTNIWAQFASAPGNSANRGIYGRASATTAGHNIGALCEAYGGNVNVAVGGASNQPKSGATNVGVAGIARNNSETTRVIGGFFGLYGPTSLGGTHAIPDFATPGYQPAALIADAGLASSTSLAFAVYKNNAAGNALTQTWQISGAGAMIALGSGIGATEIPFQIRANASQSANLFEMTSSNASSIFAAHDPVGRLRMLESSSPSHVANTGFVYTKQAASGRTELYYFDSNGTSAGVETQITANGSLVLVAANFANPTSPGVNLTGSNGTATTAMRSDAVLVLSQAIAPTWTAAHTWTPSAAGTVPMLVNLHASQSVDGFRVNQASDNDPVAINNEGLLRLRDVSGLTSAYPGQDAPYGGINDYGAGFSYGILFGMFATDSNLTELFWRNEANAEIQITSGTRLRIDTNFDYGWLETQTFADGIVVQGNGIEVGTITAIASAVTFSDDIDISTFDILTGATTGSKFGETGHKIGFLGATPILRPSGSAQGVLTNATGGSQDGTLAAVSGTGDDATINNNFTDVHTLLHAIRGALVSLGLIAGA